MKKVFWITTLAGASLLCAQTPDFSGVWKANIEKSKGVPQGGSYLTIIEQKDTRFTQTIGITTQQGERRSMYRWDLSGKETRGLLGGLPMLSTAKVEGSTLVVSGKQPNNKSMTAKYTLSEDGNTLTMEVSAGGRDQSLVLEKQPDSAGEALRKPEGTLADTGRYKNLKVIGGMPASSLGDTMNAWAFALGKECNFCHAPGADGKGLNFASDDKPEKATARKMVEMANSINKNNFNDRPQVRCFTCHQGSNHPPQPKF